MGMEKCCHLVVIYKNYNLPTSAYWHLQFKRPVGQIMTAAIRKRSCHRYCRKEFQTQLTFKNPVSKVSFPHIL